MTVPMPFDIRLSIERMKFNIISAVVDHEGELRRYLDEQIEVAINAYDFEGAVRHAADEAITSVVGAAIKGLIGWEMRRDIEQEVRETIIHRLNRPPRED